ncbi:unnamed protein product [Rotaria socialis]|uniref:Uncharacterized protein n=1 Tax=Rotaria socialis TaxID=392032 RepID=A0A819Z1B5_9BILA|nr:unnamed protein product [Rotaria socialis]CAF4485913.1 unnamed protein product [Rotaria socialis]CAF4734664.1 unnamed protein product [Rotaria socialis]
MEYRCRQGICIHLQTTFDKVINCSDAAAEYRANTHRLGGSSVFICDILSNFFSVMNIIGNVTDEDNCPSDNKNPCVNRTSGQVVCYSSNMWFLSSHNTGDCPVNYFEDDKLLCPWQNRSLFQPNVQWNNGEDEVFCGIADPPWNTAYNDRFLLDIDIYPQTTVTTTLLIKNIEHIESLKYERVAQVKQIQDQSLLYAVRYCNRGLLAYEGDSNNEFCFCPFCLYGMDRC